MKKPLKNLAELEHLVLLAVLRLGERAYGVAILEELAETAQRKATRGAVYVALRRLEEQGLLTSRLAEPTAKRGGRAKRFYDVAPSGVEALKAQRATFERMWSGLTETLET